MPKSTVPSPPAISSRAPQLLPFDCGSRLCIGDAAHAMSPIGGVGIDLAIQDAVATANILSSKLRVGVPSPEDLKAVQDRRTFPTVVMQRVQVAVQNRIIRRLLGSTKSPSVPWQLKILRLFPALRRIPARIVGLGFRPEHVIPFIAKPAPSETHRAA